MSFREFILVALLDRTGRTFGASSASLTFAGVGFRLRTHRVIPRVFEYSRLIFYPLRCPVVW